MKNKNNKYLEIDTILDFFQDGLYIADLNINMYRFCNIRLDSDKKDTLTG
jgi:hypothetical protein